ncbi:MAG: hypothetical protein PHN88_14820 [Ignavibacteria bacterium]|nr:hypothetical protein [Ignavibacteria bacterium]
MANILFKNLAEDHTVAVTMPNYGYSIEYHMPISKVKALDSSYPDAGFFDPPDENEPPVYGTFDYRLCKIPAWILPSDSKLAMNAFFDSPLYGRGLNCIMDLGNTSTGFFPFGLDKGDTGKFTVRLLESTDSGMRLSPYKRFVESYTFVLVSTDNVAPIFTEALQGDFQIGTCTGLLYPQAGFKPNSEKLIYNDISIAGVPDSIIGPAAAFSYISAFELLCNDSRAYTLLDGLINTVRSNDVTIIAPLFYYIFGYDKGTSGTYTCKLLGSTDDENETVIIMTHNGYQQWIIPLKFWRKS